MTIEQAAANLRRLRAANRRAEQRAYAQLVAAIRADQAKGVPVTAAARRANLSRDTVHRLLREHPS